MPLMAIPLLLAAAFVDPGHAGFLALFALIALFLIGGHFGLHSIAGIFYPSAYRGNGAGWATSVAKIGSIAGPFAAGTQGAGRYTDDWRFCDGRWQCVSAHVTRL